MRGSLAGIVCLAVAALMSACGSSSDDGARRTTPAPPAAVAPITIQVPVDGARRQARETAGGRLRARVGVRGTASAGAEVFISADCRPQPCRAQARAGAGGRWKVTLTLSTPRAGRFVTIDANAQRDVAAAGSAVTTVELVAPRRSQTARTGASPSRSSQDEPRPGAVGGSAPRRALPRDVLVIGDSLALGIEQPLNAALAGWRVRVDGRIGRPLTEGMGILGRQHAPPAILAFSLFTNNGPGETPALEAAVRSTAGRPGGCVIWATVVRPPLNGVSYDAANALLRRLALDPELAPRLRLVDWAAAVAQSPSLIAGDRVHGTPDGYRVLAQLYAAAITSCAAGA